MRALGFVGEKRLQAARDRLPGVVQQWYRQWCVGDRQSPCQVSCHTLADAPWQDQAANWQRFQLPFGAVYLAGDWSQMIFGPLAAQVPADRTAEHLLSEAQRALLNGFLQAFALAAIESMDGRVVDDPRGALGAQVAVRIEAGSCSVQLLLDGALLNDALPSVAPGKSLYERKSALGNARLKLSVRLPLSSLRIGEINDLRPGDTLLAAALLIDPLQVHLDQHGPVAAGYLAQQQGQLALQLVSNE